MTSDPLTLARQCAYCLRDIIRELGVGNQAEAFSSEDPELWVVVDQSEVRLVAHERLVAVFHVEHNDRVQVIIPDVYNLIRGQHQSEFVPGDYGILPRPPPDILGNQEPQLTIDTFLPDPATLLQGERQYIPESTFYRKPVSKRHYDPKG